jgi:propanol-preferring alcohol dehydrogenase
MKAMLLESQADMKTKQTPLRLLSIAEPTLAPSELLLRVTRCGVCHTELDEIEGRTPPPHLSVVLGHQVVGVVEGIQSLQTLDIPGKVERRETFDSN